MKLKINIAYVLIIALFMCGNTVFSQVIPGSVIKKNNLNRASSFFEIKKAMNEYWASTNVNNGFVLKNGLETKVPYWKIYKRWEYFWEQRVNQVTGEFPKTTSADEYEKYKSSPKNSKRESDFAESWSNIGTNTSTGGYAGLGRINCVAFHPTDANIFWVGSPSGGIWKTTNAGTNWTILNNSMTTLGVSDIVIPGDYATSNTIYIATGDRDGGSMWSLSGGQSADNASIGVYKSTDGGATWNSTGLTYATSEQKLLYALRIHPSNTSILFASMYDGNPSTSGIWKSTDAGVSWVKKTNNLWGDIEFKPGDPTIMYAVSNGYAQTYINRSTNSGETWTVASVANPGYRGEIAVTPADPAVVYLLSSNSAGGVKGIYKSTDSGVSFSVVNAGSPSGMLGYYTNGTGGSGGQGSYDLCIAVKPDNANTVFIGGITTWRSTNGGTTFTANTNWTSSGTYNLSGVPVVHADKHVLAYQSSTVLFEGNDGGIYKTTNNGTSWTDLSNGLNISQIYRIGVSQTSSSTVLNGLQDNGSKLYNGSWSDVTGGDGMECIVDYSTTQYMYATYVQGTIYRSTNSGASFPATISANLPGGQRTGAWVTPYVMDPNNSSILFAGYDSVYKTINRGTSWTLVSQSLSTANKLRSLAIAPSNSSVLYAADPVSMWKTTNGGGSNWTSVTLPAITDYVTYITVKNTDANTLWITVGGYTDGSKVYESTNGGTSWTNISAGMPNLPVMCIVQNKRATDRNVLFAGTDVGVYVKDGSSNWASYNNGLPNVVVTELEIYYGGSPDKLRAGTFGRGLWETNIDGVLPVELSSFTSSVNNNNVALLWSTSSEENNKGFEIERSRENKSDWVRIGFVEGKGNSNQNTDYSFNDSKLNAGKYHYRLKQVDYNGNYKYHNLSDAVYVGVPEKFGLSQNYPNPFNPSTRIDYNLPVDTKVSIKVYDNTGREVANIVNTSQSAGYYSVQFNSENLSNGVYYCKMVAGDFSMVKKMLLLK